jgi:hypothetical protein
MPSPIPKSIAKGTVAIPVPNRKHIVKNVREWETNKKANAIPAVS